MNVDKAKQLLNNFGSTHEYKIGKYYADFSIKVYHPHIPNDLTDKERAYVEADIDPYETVRDNLLGEVSAIAPVEITGRSGGWLTVEWDHPSNDADIIKIAKDIEAIHTLVRNALAFVCSEEFWRNFVEGADPKSSPNYNPKTKLVTSIIMYAHDSLGVALAISRGEERRYYYHRDGNVERLLAVLNSPAYDRQVKFGKVLTNYMFVHFEKR